MVTSRKETLRKFMNITGAPKFFDKRKLDLIQFAL